VTTQSTAVSTKTLYSAGPANDLPRTWSLGLPVGVGLILLVVAMIIPAGEDYDLVLRSESGLIESLTIIGCLIGCIASLIVAQNTRKLPHARLFQWYMYLFAAGFFLLAGEEASWGQHLFGWTAPTEFGRETNLHNLSIQTEQIPKVILHAAAILGGLIWPLFGAKRWQTAPDWWKWLLPTAVVVPTILIALAVRLVERVFVWFDIEPVYTRFENFKELKEANEIFLVYFLILYVFSLRKRIGALKDT
jgi:hypothetical protein